MDSWDIEKGTFAWCMIFWIYHADELHLREDFDILCVILSKQPTKVYWWKDLALTWIRLILDHSYIIVRMSKSMSVFPFCWFADAQQQWGPSYWVDISMSWQFVQPLWDIYVSTRDIEVAGIKILKKNRSCSEAFVAIDDVLYSLHPEQQNMPF